MIGVFIFIGIILFILTFPYFVLLIVTLIEKDEISDLYQGCPKIHTIGDLIDACIWRANNTGIGAGLVVPFIGAVVSLFVIFSYILSFLCELLVRFLLLFRIDIKKVFNNCSRYWKRFRNIIIFKNNEDVKNEEGEDKDI